MLYLVVFYMFLFITLSAAASGDLVQVSTINGVVNGLELETANNHRFFAFLGMRYAQPPVGPFRFRSPLPAVKWAGVYNATTERSPCLSSSSPLNNTTVVGNEDCLFINVYTPQLAENLTKLSVIVWIHGGGFIFGSGNIGLHGADRFIEHEVILVSLNYRLGIFGFLSTEDNIIPGNYGLKDQILALQWVQQNIESFGGDKTRVTIFGESAGAASVHYLRQAKRAKGLFQRAIANSGSTLNPWTKAPNPTQIAFRIGLLNGIWTTSSKNLVERLRNVESVQLQRSTILPVLLDLWDPMNGLPFSPCLEPPSDEAVVTELSYELQKSGQFNQGELLHGFNSLEGREAAKLPWLGIILLEQYNFDSSKLTPKNMNPSNGGKRVVGNAIRSFYFHNRSVSDGPNLVNFVSDNEFVRGIVKTSKLEAKYSPVYLYSFSFTGGIQHNAFQPEGVSHAEELQFLFLANDTKQVTPAAQLTVERMMQMWTNFAKVGNPTPIQNQVINITWPVVNASGPGTIHYLDIGTDLVPEINPEKKQMQFWDNLYYKYGYPPYSTY